MERSATAFARRLDNSHHPQAIDSSLGEQQAAPEQLGQLTGGERVGWKGRQFGEEVVRCLQLHAIEHVDQSPFTWVACSATRADRLPPPDMIFAQQQHLDSQMRV
jgi:hypothetical protein